MITSQQLFYLAILMDARYLDFSYISAMGIVEDNFAVYESRVLEELVDLGLVSENFNGDIEILNDIKPLFEPLFVGNAELSIDICSTVGDNLVDIYKYHFLGDHITRVHYTDGKYELDTVDISMVGDAVCGLFPEDVISNTTVIKSISSCEINHLISVKSVVVGVSSRVDNLLRTDEGILIERDDNCFEILEKNTYLNELLSFLKVVV